MVVEHLAERVAGVLSAGVAVMDQLDVGAGVATRERHPQRVEHEIGAHVAGELPADDPAEKTSMTNAKNTTPSQQRR